MLRSTKELDNFAISATDGLIGHLKDFYFDDDKWVVRYFVVDAGTWLSSRMVLISPIAVQQPNWLARTLPVSITQEQVKHSPDIDTDKPVSRQHEEQYLSYYGYPSYWGGVGMWGEGLYPYAMFPGYAGSDVDKAERERDEAAYASAYRSRHRNDDPHLRSCRAVVGYHLQATDGELGHVAGFLLDDATWAIRYLIVDTSNWWGGHQVLVAPEWITGVHWSDQMVTVDLSRDAIKEAPHYDAGVAWTPQKDESLYRHYRRTGFKVHGTVMETEI